MSKEDRSWHGGRGTFQGGRRPWAQQEYVVGSQRDHIWPWVESKALFLLDWSDHCITYCGQNKTCYCLSSTCLAVAWCWVRNSLKGTCCEWELAMIKLEGICVKKWTLFLEVAMATSAKWSVTWKCVMLKMVNSCAIQEQGESVFLEFYRF